MALCLKCGDSVPEGSCTCPTCGSAMDNSIPCARCGFPILPGSTKCASCGRILAQPHAYRTSGFRLQGCDTDFAASTGAVEVHADSDSSWWHTVEDKKEGSGAVNNARKRTDPLFLAALVLALASLSFYWVAVIDVSLAGAALILSVIGYHHHFSYKFRGRYSGLWVNFIATGLGVLGLIAGYGFTAFFQAF